MKSSPWLLVAVYVRAPEAEAPIATDSAANSDSTLMNSQFASSPDFTISPRPSTMWVCGVIGYAQITCGRHSATASATAREPSVCLSIGRLPGPRSALERLIRSGDVALRNRRRELFPDRAHERLHADHARHRGESTQE